MQTRTVIFDSILFLPGALHFHIGPSQLWRRRLKQVLCSRAVLNKCLNVSADNKEGEISYRSHDLSSCRDVRVTNVERMKGVSCPQRNTEINSTTHEAAQPASRHDLTKGNLVHMQPYRPIPYPPQASGHRLT